jgi:hypothetical protein
MIKKSLPALKSFSAGVFVRLLATGSRSAPIATAIVVYPAVYIGMVRAADVVAENSYSPEVLEVEIWRY